MEYKTFNPYIPKKLSKPSINEAILEFRFETNIRIELLKVELYNFMLFVVGNDEKKIQKLPETQIPEQVLESDDRLKYRPLYRCVNKNFVMAVGIHTLSFSVFNPYPGWAEWKKEYISAAQRFLNSNFISGIARVGLRYIDFFKGDVIDSLNLNLEINNQKIRNGTFFDCSFFVDYNIYKCNIRINNTDFMQQNNDHITVVDIDNFKLDGLEKLNILSNFETFIDDMHLRNKEVFFSILSDKLIKEMEE